MVYRSSLVPVTCSQAITPLALPVLTPDMVLVRPFCPGTPGDKMHHLEARYPPPPPPAPGKSLRHQLGQPDPSNADQNVLQLGLSSPGVYGPSWSPRLACLPARAVAVLKQRET